MRRWTGSALVQLMACRLFGTKPLIEPMLIYSQFDPQEQTSVKFEPKYKKNHSWKYNWKCRQRNSGHLSREGRVKVADISADIFKCFLWMKKCISKTSHWNMFAIMTPKHKTLHSWKYISKYHLRNSDHFVQGEMTFKVVAISVDIFTCVFLWMKNLYI